MAEQTPRPLSPAQQRALEKIRTAGELHPYNGVRADTVAALETAGLVNVDWKPPTHQRGLPGTRGHWVQNWVARPAQQASEGSS
jgi:hypothetical protein